MHLRDGRKVALTAEAGRHAEYEDGAARLREMTGAARRDALVEARKA
jgi:hypothetical protein